MRLPVKNLFVVILNPEISGLISKLDSGSRKGNTCLKSAKFFDQIVLFESFEIPQPVLNLIQYQAC
jgi:hypothetical protein